MTTQPTEPMLIVEGNDVTTDAPVVGRGRMVLRRFLRRRMATIGLVVIALMFLLAFVGPYLIKWNYAQTDLNAILSPPSTAHWFGTDNLGQDLFAQTLRGMQKSLLIGLVGGLLSTTIAAILGAVAGYFGRAADRTVMIVIDLMLILPAFLIIAVMSPLFQGESWLIFVVLLAAFQWMLTARVVRGLTQSLREREFVSAARFMGVSRWKIIFRHILPNMASFLIIDATLNVSTLILAEVALAYFGFGVRPPDVSLGTLIQAGEPSYNTFWWLFYLPALMVVILTLAVNLVGDGLRDALDPTSSIGK